MTKNTLKGYVAAREYTQLFIQYQNTEIYGLSLILQEITKELDYIIHHTSSKTLDHTLFFLIDMRYNDAFYTEKKDKMRENAEDKTEAENLIRRIDVIRGLHSKDLAVYQAILKDSFDRLQPSEKEQLLDIIPNIIQEHVNALRIQLRQPEQSVAAIKRKSSMVDKVVQNEEGSSKRSR